MGKWYRVTQVTTFAHELSEARPRRGTEQPRALRNGTASPRAPERAPGSAGLPLACLTHRHTLLTARQAALRCARATLVTPAEPNSARAAAILYK